MGQREETKTEPQKMVLIKSLGQTAMAVKHDFKNYN
jgi:hypothetical protein